MQMIQQQQENALPLPIHENEGRLWVDARTLHAALKVGRDFSTWITSRLNEVDAVENEDFIVLDGSPNLGSKWGGSNRRDYWLNLDIAKEVAMLERNEVGKQIRRYFIEAEKGYRARLVALPDFTNPAAAARAWADEVEAKQLERAAKEQAQQQLALAAPKVQQFDALMSTDGTYSVGNAAKILGFGELRLFALLRERGILQDKYKGGAQHHNVPYQRYLDAGYFKLVTRASTDGKHVTYTTRVTPVGLAWIQRGMVTQHLLPPAAPQPAAVHA